MYEQTVLKNGLNVVTKQMDGRESCGIAFWVRTGSRFESKPIAGASHFLEHMLFKGTKHRITKEIKQDIEGVGGLFNAFTGEESTCYFVKIPKNNFGSAFDVLQDMVNHSILPPDEFKKEKTVILEEIKMYLDLPAQHVHELLTELMWPKEALGRPIAGTLASVTGITRENLYDYYKRYYHPRNFLVTACGEIEHERVLTLSKRAFGSIDGNQKASEYKPAVTEIKKNRYHFFNKKTEQTHFVMGFHSISRKDKRKYVLAVLNVLLGANMSSRLFEEVREKRGLAYEIKSGLSFYEDTGAATISVGVEPTKARETAQVILHELEKIKNKLVPEDELRRAKDYFLGQLTLGLEDTLDHILWFGERVLYGGDIPQLKDIREEIEKTSAEDVMKLAGEIFRQNKVHLALIGPIETENESRLRKVCEDW